jgi:hypothetical protein
MSKEYIKSAKGLRGKEMKDRFNLEQEIMNCWHVVEDLDVLFEAVLERDLTTDQISNIILGMRELYQLKFDIMFNTFEGLIKESAFESNVNNELVSSLFDDGTKNEL